jgi:hypothetical protein
MRHDDRLLMRGAELDALLRKEVPRLPKRQRKEAAAVDDLERLLEETAEEVAQSDVALSPYTEAELKGMADEDELMNTALKELKEKLSSYNEDERTEIEHTTKKIQLMERMMSIQQQIYDLRAQECTVGNFIECIRLDLLKARANLGELGESESEGYENDDEKELTPHQLLTLGVQYLEQDLKTALHYLRLAAVHHKHPTSISLLHRLYTKLGNPRGAFMLLERALDDTELDPVTNTQVAEMMDCGARHFPPVLGMTIYFYQRAALCGSTSAMIALSQLFIRGSTNATTLNESEREENVNVKKAQMWLQLALDRGSGAAYFIRGCMHLKGEHGVQKSYKDARSFLDRAKLCQSEVVKAIPQLERQLEALRIEESGLSGRRDSPATPSSPAASPAAHESGAPPPTGYDKLAARLQQLDERPGVGTSFMDSKKSASKKTNASGAVSARVFWERAAVAATGVYALWALAFPLRVRLLPTFYSIVVPLLESLGGWGLNPNGPSLEAMIGGM